MPRRFPQTELSRRLQAGESLPAYRPPSLPPLQPMSDAQEAAALKMIFGPHDDAPARLPAGRRETRPGRDIPAEDARAAAMRVREWLAHEGCSIDTADFVTVARWVMHATRED